LQGSTARSYKRGHFLFLAWCRSSAVDVNRFTVVQLVDFLEKASQSQYAVSTVLLFRSAVLEFHVYADSITTARTLREFLRQLKREAPLLRLSHTSVNLSPSLEHLRSIASDSSSYLTQLSTKCAFLLAAAAFLRPSDLHRIVLSASHVQADGALLLVIDAPKETRQGRHICKELTIRPLPQDPALCPVQAFQALVSHPLRSSSPALFVNSRAPSRRLAVTTLSAFLRRILRVSVPSIPGKRGPSVRSAASDTTLRNGAPLDDILLMGNWSSSTVLRHALPPHP
ncbi:hypothetical protein BX666DRAFT_1860206, partial [Dichotomocladium elegans]